MQTLQDEIINNDNFALVNNGAGEITRELKVYLQNYKLLDPANDKLPFLYWTPKMHKEPIEPRNITSGKDCIISNLSKMVCLCLQKLLNIEKKYCKDRFEMHNKFFIIYNHIYVISHMNNSNSNNNPNKSIKHLISKHFTPKFHTINLRKQWNYLLGMYLDIIRINILMFVINQLRWSISEVMDYH